MAASHRPSARPAADSLVLYDLSVAAISQPSSTTPDMPPDVDARRRRALVLALPDELLAIIVELAVAKPRYLPPTPYDQLYNHEAGRRLALTCRRFHRIVLPFLYHSIRFVFAQLVPPGMRIKCLHRSIDRQPSLRPHCRRLYIYAQYFFGSKSRAVDLFLANYFAQRLTNVRSLKIEGGFHGRHSWRTWELLRRCVQNMRAIDCLSLRGSNLCQGRVMEHAELPSLRRLDLHGISAAVGDGAALKPEKHGSAQFTELFLSDYGESAFGLEQLIKWPRRLKLFYIRHSFPYYSKDAMDLPMFGAMLQGHKQSLRRIRIGLLPPPSRPGRLLDVSDFPALEYLELSRWNMESLEAPAQDAQLLLAPNLKLFGWDCSVMLWRPRRNDFGDEEARWLRGFAEAAIATGARLAEINVVLTRRDCRRKQGDSDPWELMGKARDEFEPHGLRVTCNTTLSTC